MAAGRDDGLAPVLTCQLATEFRVAAALCFVTLCVFVWIGTCLPALLGWVGPNPEVGPPPQPLKGSLSWARRLVVKR